MSKKIKPTAINVTSQTQHSRLSERLTAVVKKKVCTILSGRGLELKHVYEIDFHKQQDVFDFEDSDFCLEMTGQTIKDFLETLMLEPSLREIILDYVKDNP
jgi:hypothetical protein